MANDLRYDTRFAQPHTLLRSHVMCRTTKQCPGENSAEPILKPVTGLESMRITGWDPLHWVGGDAPGFTSLSDSQLRRMAGNAFSAFCFAPIFACLLASQGLTPANLDHVSTCRQLCPLCHIGNQC